MKEEIFKIFNPKKHSANEMEKIIWNYFMDYWNNRRICSTNDGFPPAIKRGIHFLKMEEKAA